MTIAERKARDAYDRENLWRQIATITDDMIGVIIELRTSYQGMSKDQGHRRYFRDITGWYQIEPPEKLWRWALVIQWRSTGTRDRRQNGTRELLLGHNPAHTVEIGAPTRLQQRRFPRQWP